MKDKLKQKSVIFGILGSIALFGIYFMILALLNSAEHALNQFIDLWYFMVPLIIGFGIQIGLYVYVKESFKFITSTAGTTTAVAASGSMSTASMVACCAHHLTDILPVLGLTFLSTILAKYQITFILLGVLSNIVGITMMLNVIQKNSLHENWKGIFGGLMKLDMQKTQKVVIIISILIFLVSLYITILRG